MMLTARSRISGFTGAKVGGVRNDLAVKATSKRRVAGLSKLTGLGRVDGSLIVGPSCGKASLAKLSGLRRLKDFGLKSAASADGGVALGAIGLPSLLKIANSFIIGDSIVRGVSVPGIRFVNRSVCVASSTLLSLSTGTIRSIKTSLVIGNSMTRGRSTAARTVIFSTLGRVKGRLAVRCFPGLRKVCLPTLRDITNATSFSSVSSVKDLTVARLRSIKKLTVGGYGRVSVIRLPNLVSYKRADISTGGIGGLGVTSLGSMLNSVALDGLLVRRLSLSRVGFGKGALALRYTQLGGVMKSRAFGNDLLLLPGDYQLARLALRKVSGVRKSFRYGSCFCMGRFIVPFVHIAKSVAVTLGSKDIGATTRVRFPGLLRVKKALALRGGGGTGGVAFPLLGGVLNSYSIAASGLGGSVRFAGLRDVKASKTSTRVGFRVRNAGVLYPGLGAVGKGFSVAASSFVFNVRTSRMSCPGMRSVSRGLSVAYPCSSFNSGNVLSVSFSNLGSMGKVDVDKRKSIASFDSFGCLFRGGILAKRSR